jgi:hypothetical protein
MLSFLLVPATPSQSSLPDCSGEVLADSTSPLPLSCQERGGHSTDSNACLSRRQGVQSGAQWELCKPKWFAGLFLLWG